MLKIRLRRMGKRHSPFYRVVVSDSRRTPTASAVDEVGHYDPQPTPPRLALNLDRLRYWQEQGAQLSPTVRRLIQRAESGTLEAPAAEAAKPAPASKKAKAKEAAKAKEQPAAEAAPAPIAEVSDEAAKAAAEPTAEPTVEPSVEPSVEAPPVVAEALAVEESPAEAASEEPAGEAEPAVADESDEKPTEA